MRYATVMAAAAVALSAAVVVVTAAGTSHGAVTPPALTAQQAEQKAAICAQFESNVQMPAALLSAAQMATACPWVSA